MGFGVIMIAGAVGVLDGVLVGIGVGEGFWLVLVIWLKPKKLRMMFVADTV